MKRRDFLKYGAVIPGVVSISSNGMGMTLPSDRAGLDESNESNRVQSSEAQVEYILENFEFENVHTAMKAINWEWANDDNDESSVPTVERLKNMARNMFDDLLEHPMRESTSNCWLTASRWDGEFDLEFTLARCSSWQQ